METLTASKLRANIYRILDQVIASGQPIEVNRRGVKLKIVPTPRKDRLEGLTHRNIFKVDPTELIHCDWQNEWKPPKGNLPKSF